jgi:hypothetical protein
MYTLQEKLTCRALRYGFLLGGKLCLLLLNEVFEYVMLFFRVRRLLVIVNSSFTHVDTDVKAMRRECRAVIYPAPIYS